MKAELGGLRVLLVDDNPHMRTIVATILRGIGVEHVYEAEDGLQAMGLLRDWAADIAIVDYRMEKLDGVELTRKIRTDPRSPNPFLPIIMMTGYADKVHVEEARDAGVTEFLVKPITAQGVIDRIKAVIFHARPFVRTKDYFGPHRRGIDDEAAAPVPSVIAHI